MRNIDQATSQALRDAPEKGLILRELVWFRVRGLTSPAQRGEFAFWNELDTNTINVFDPKLGQVVSRTYVGGYPRGGDGPLIGVEDIPLTTDLTVRTLRLTLSPLHPTVEDMARGYDIRIADVQIHRALFDPATRNLASTPMCHFVGFVNKAPLGTAAVADESGIDIECVSDVRNLTRTNPSKKSDETYKRRQGDRFGRYLGVAGGITVFWGSKKGKIGDD